MVVAVGVYSVNFFCGSGCAGFCVVCRGGVGCGWGGLVGCHGFVSVAGGGGSGGEAEGPEPVVVGALGVAVVDSACLGELVGGGVEFGEELGVVGDVEVWCECLGVSFWAGAALWAVWSPLAGEGFDVSSPAALGAGGCAHGFSELGGHAFLGGLGEDDAFQVAYSGAFHVFDYVVAYACLVDGGVGYAAPVVVEAFQVSYDYAVWGVELESVEVA